MHLYRPPFLKLREWLSWVFNDTLSTQWSTGGPINIPPHLRWSVETNSKRAVPLKLGFPYPLWLGLSPQGLWVCWLHLVAPLGIHKTHNSVFEKNPGETDTEKNYRVRFSGNHLPFSSSECASPHTGTSKCQPRGATSEKSMRPPLHSPWPMNEPRTTELSGSAALSAPC